MTSDSPQVEGKSYGMRTILLTSWASVATALFLLVLIGGAIYINDKHLKCESDDGTTETRRDQYNDGYENEDIYMDSTQNRLFIKRDKDGAIILIADQDYHTKISAVYLARTDECVLSAGEDMDWYQDWDAPKLNMSAANLEHATYTRHEADPDNRVTDMSLLPTYIRPFCQGKPIHWSKPAEPVEHDGSLSRQKRASNCWLVCWWCEVPPYAQPQLCCVLVCGCGCGPR